MGPLAHDYGINAVPSGTVMSCSLIKKLCS